MVEIAVKTSTQKPRVISHIVRVKIGSILRSPKHSRQTFITKIVVLHVLFCNTTHVSWCLCYRIVFKRLEKNNFLYISWDTRVISLRPTYSLSHWLSYTIDSRQEEGLSTLVQLVMFYWPSLLLRYLPTMAAILNSPGSYHCLHQNEAAVGDLTYKPALQYKYTCNMPYSVVSFATIRWNDVVYVSVTCREHCVDVP